MSVTPTVFYLADSNLLIWTINIIGPYGQFVASPAVPQPGVAVAQTFIYLIDSSNTLWEVGIEPTGNLTQTIITNPNPANFISYNTESTLTLLDVMQWAHRFVGNRPLAIGNSLQPALQNANLVLQTIMGPPFNWRWNRVSTGFMTVVGQQDYYVWNRMPTAQVAVGWQTVDSYGNAQVCTTSGVTGSGVPTWNNTPGGTTTDGTSPNAVVWTNLGSLKTDVSQNYSLGWAETHQIFDPTTSKWYELTNKENLSLDSSQDRPKYVSAQVDDGSGNILFRCMPVPDQAYPVVTSMQQQPTLFTSVNQTWAPIPDRYSRIYSYGFLSLTLLFAGDERWQQFNSMFITSLLATVEGLGETERNIFMNSWQSIVNNGQIQGQRLTQGSQARSISG